MTTEDRIPEASGTRPLFVVEADSLEAWLKTQSPEVQSWVADQGFKAGLGASLSLPTPDRGVVLGHGQTKARARKRFGVASQIGALPEAHYALANPLDPADQLELALGFHLGSYRFDRYADQTPVKATLQCPPDVDEARLTALVQGECLTRDLINTPAADMDPDTLAESAKTLAGTHGANCEVFDDPAVVARDFPMIHAVGRAAERGPRLIDMRWGNAGPKVTLVGKGVCFDTGGLNLKPGASMGLMKKDMGGAANVLGLAHMIMALGLAVQLRVLIPAVENAVAGNAFRPQDILTSRKGLTVEINNTDAEGRLVLADALAYGDEESPDLMVCMATLTGAARVAVGADLAPYYTDDEQLSDALVEGAEAGFDPVWRMPFHEPYEAMIEPGIADLDNAPKGGFAGSITAALFLRRFVDQAHSFAHFDVYGWQPSAAPGRPKGGVGQGCRAILAAIERLV